MTTEIGIIHSGITEGNTVNTSDIIQLPIIMSNHPWSYMSGHWLLFLGIHMFAGKECYIVLHKESGTLDAWPIKDPSLKDHLFFGVGSFPAGN